MIADMPWMKGSQFSMAENWNPGVQAVRSGYQVGVSSRNKIVDQGLDAFLNLLRETENYGEALENKIRANW